MKKDIRAAVSIGSIVALLGSVNVWAGTIYATEPATNITPGGATLNGNAQSTVGLSGEKFEYGETTSYGKTAGAAPQGVNGPVSGVVAGLKCSTVYHYRFVGDPKPPRTTLQGSDMTFTTLACPAKYVNVNAGPIWSNAEAPQICPNVCSNAKGTWSGQWTTTQESVMSVCGCWISK
jgi:hypothetical protein